jgi:hypothetical protein
MERASPHQTVWCHGECEYAINLDIFGSDGGTGAFAERVYEYVADLRLPNGSCTMGRSCSQHCDAGSRDDLPPIQ